MLHFRKSIINSLWSLFHLFWSDFHFRRSLDNRSCSAKNIFCSLFHLRGSCIHLFESRWNLGESFATFRVNFNISVEHFCNLFERFFHPRIRVINLRERQQNFCERKSNKHRRNSILFESEIVLWPIMID